MIFTNSESRGMLALPPTIHHAAVHRVVILETVHVYIVKCGCILKLLLLLLSCYLNLDLITLYGLFIMDDLVKSCTTFYSWPKNVPRSRVNNYQQAELLESLNERDDSPYPLFDSEDNALVGFWETRSGTNGSSECSYKTF